MTRSVKPMRALALLVMSSLVLAGCASKVKKPVVPTEAPTPVVPAAPAKPLVDKGDPDQRFTAALKLMKDRQAKDAYDAFLQLAKDFPEFSGPLTDLAILQSNAKQRAPATINFQKAVRANPQNFLAQNWLGTLQRENGDYAAAQTAYQAALAIKSDYAPAHLNLGLLYDVYLKRPQDALNEYREYQRIAGSDKLIVTAWIRDLEDRLPPPPAATPAPAAPVPVAPAGPAKPSERKS